MSEAAKGAFSRIVAIHDGDTLDRALLDQAAMLAAMDASSSTVVAALPGAATALALGDAARSAFAERGARDVTLRLLPEPDVDAALDAARDHNADLLVVRNPRGLKRGRVIGKRLLAESPCALWFALGDKPGLELHRVVVGAGLTPEGAELLERMAHFCAAAGADEMLAVHARFRETLAAGEDVDRRFRDQSMLELYRFMARVPLNGTSCTPVLEEHARYRQAILKAVTERDAQLAVVGRSVGGGIEFLRGQREALDLLCECPAPLLQVPLAGAKSGLLEALQKRLFRESEPAFN